MMPEYGRGTMIEITGLTKSFGGFTAVKNLSLRIEGGEIFGFLGPNGAGKTTTIKMMTGLFSPSAGTIRLGGHDITSAPLQAKLITGYIPDQPFLYEKLTGREFLYFSAGLYRLDHTTATRRIADLASQFELSEWLDRRTEYYSQGMRQRIAIASALLHDPGVLVIDEPMVGLDPRSAHITKEAFRDRARAGAAVFMSTHSLPVVEELCDRIGIIKNGSLLFDGSLAEFGAMRDRRDGSFESAFLEMTS